MNEHTQGQYTPPDIHPFELQQARRGVVACIIFTIITFGIYSYYWLFQLLRFMYRMNGRPSTAGTDIVLGLVTCGIYFIYLYYKMGKMESEMHARNNMPPRDDSVMYVILGLFGFAIVNYAIIQANTNQLLDTLDGGGPAGPNPNWDSGTGRANY